MTAEIDYTEHFKIGDVVSPRQHICMIGAMHPHVVVDEMGDEVRVRHAAGSFFVTHRVRKDALTYHSFNEKYKKKFSILSPESRAMAILKELLDDAIGALKRQHGMV